MPRALTVQEQDTVKLRVAVVRRKTERAFQLMLDREHLGWPVAVWVPKVVLWGQNVDLEQRDIEVRIPQWLWDRILVELKEVN